MGGVPPVESLKADYNQKAQAAALMMSVNGKLSHDPPSSWDCYSSDGKTGAGNSNLYLGVFGPDAISGYIYDPGSGNYPVGHRRWILYPQTKHMGTGDIPPVSGEWKSNALWVFDLDSAGTIFYHQKVCPRKILSQSFTMLSWGNQRVFAIDQSERDRKACALVFVH